MPSVPRNAFFSLICVAALLLGTHVGRAADASSLSLVSPFDNGGAGTAVEGSREPTDYEYVGAIKAGEETMVGILNKATQKSFWVGVGKSAEGFDLMSRSAGGDEITARYAGNVHTLKLKEPAFAKGSVVAYVPPAQTLARPAGPAPLVPPVRPAVQPKSGPPVTPQQQINAEQEREARMLVSDLLEIGAQQRKAYEEAQKRKSAPPPPGQAPTKAP